MDEPLTLQMLACRVGGLVGCMFILNALALGTPLSQAAEIRID
jgi:hypothetical protein